MDILSGWLCTTTGNLLRSVPAGLGLHRPRGTLVSHSTPVMPPNRGSALHTSYGRLPENSLLSAVKNLLRSEPAVLGLQHPKGNLVSHSIPVLPPNQVNTLHTSHGRLPEHCLLRAVENLLRSEPDVLGLHRPRGTKV